METITGTEAIQKMRALRNDENVHFLLMHHTFDRRKKTSDGLRKVEQCRLRPSLPDEIFDTDSDLYLPYYDLLAKKNGMCFKILMRFCAFPPDYKVLKINWFNS
jgi:hypothetical protein